MFGGEGAVMTTLDVVSSKMKKEPTAEELAAVELVRLAQEQGLSVTGPNGLLKQFTKTVLETALNEELTEHLGHEKHHAPEDRDGTNVRNGTRPKTVLTEAAGEVTIDVPRDRDGTFEPAIVKNRQRRLTGVDEIVLSLYANPNPTAARAALDEFTELWGTKYGAIVRLWENAWEEFIPFLDYDIEIRTVICSTNAIESLNARYRRAVRARGHFPTEQAALKCLYLVTRSLDPTGAGRARWTMRWKPALNAFAITFADRWPFAETY
jgi:transposase-like protein